MRLNGIIVGAQDHMIWDKKEQDYDWLGFNGSKIKTWWDPGQILVNTYNRYMIYTSMWTYLQILMVDINTYNRDKYL